MEPNYNKLAHASLNLFASTTGDVLSSKKYDLILAGGDSGSIMAWIVEAIYKETEQKPPQKLVLPIYRHADYA